MRTIFRAIAPLLTVLVLFTALVGLVSSCAREQEPAPEKFTLGNVQKRIAMGMSQADVAQALGSPNIVTKDSSGKEVWVYDKIAQEVSYSKNSAGIGGGLGGGVWLIGGGFGHSSGSAQSSQRALTVTVRFDDQSRVENVSYHSSQF